MAEAASKLDRRYTYRDYLGWQDGERWELIGGAVYNMTPVPSRQHQALVGNIFAALHAYFRDKTCEVYVAPFDVRLPAAGEDPDAASNVVQPDIVVVCDKAKLDDRGCLGAPDLVVEVVSPDTAKKDMAEKLDLYERAGVKEYWIVHPGDQTVMVFCLGDDGKYGRHKMYEKGETLAAAIFPELVIELAEIFA
ncbi:Uma2 family endonuclease [Sporolituus thermophilus]|uniref:Endonuclease, Uma2 family (Restriction endonuclease fold) n=1 Tax=Sporolituus thermophilus DSM 23256 TaxID=1123285 RepID=A0A1G7HFW1_9FIRM|nr:Uma2 family endonuclease [Sporolituus thermophilus]SDE99194.1 Endonuclease, Uma2 family (restriction endonuclease fold) [Sporolituus thermophilus DSM 23256]